VPNQRIDQSGRGRRLSPLRHCLAVAASGSQTAQRPPRGARLLASPKDGPDMNLADIRGLFPGLKDTIYLNTATMAVGCAPAREAYERALDRWSAGRFDWLEAERAGEDARGVFAQIAEEHPMPPTLDEIRYPIGRLQLDPNPTEAKRSTWITRSPPCLTSSVPPSPASVIGNSISRIVPAAGPSGRSHTTCRTST